ncbi:CPBP family intramembrane glutamic endopeptidase, partial [Actinoplanes sp. NPDC051633]|uniref:CPBP family intramembrane glutamic endopeptidase n=1 Tax=Actinoplanes sp. NPDC051633 TaxID=3155670 RepID=UPI00344A8572
MSSFRTLVRSHRLIAFFALAYVLTWAPLPWGSFSNIGALVSALVVAFVADGLGGLKEIGKRVIRWRVNWIWYALALAVPLLVNAGTMVLTMVTGAAAPEGAASAWLGVPLAIGITMVNPLNGPLSEEPSFRGYALPILQNRHSPLLSAGILAVLITVWHGPLFFLDQFHLKPYEAITTVAVTFWYVWLFDQAGGSALITLIAHSAEGSINIDGLYAEGSSDATRAIVFNLLLWCVVALSLLVAYRKFWTSPAPEAAREPVEPD